MSGKLQVVDGQFGQPLQPPHQVVGEEADHAARQRRQARGSARGGQQLQGGAQRLQRVAAGGRVLRHRAQPHRFAVAHRQRRRRAGADERPPRPRPAVLGRLQQEGAGPVGGELAVRRQRGLAVGQDLAGHRHHPVLGRQRAEILPRGGGGEVGVHRTIHPSRAMLPAGGASTRRRSVAAMKTGDTVADFELPDQTGTPRKLSDSACRRARGAVLLSGRDDARLHQGGLPLPRLGRRIRRRRRQPGRHQHRSRRRSRPSSPTRRSSTTRCCRTPTARSPPSSASSAACSAS